jgi:hypothetical protein
MWRHLVTTGELLENRVYNTPNGCSATGALALGPDHQQQQQQQQGYTHKYEDLTRKFGLRESRNIVVAMYS